MADGVGVLLTGTYMVGVMRYGKRATVLITADACVVCVIRNSFIAQQEYQSILSAGNRLSCVFGDSCVVHDNEMLILLHKKTRIQSFSSQFVFECLVNKRQAYSSQQRSVHYSYGITLLITSVPAKTHSMMIQSLKPEKANN